MKSKTASLVSELAQAQRALADAWINPEDGARPSDEELDSKVGIARVSVEEALALARELRTPVRVEEARLRLRDADDMAAQMQNAATSSEEHDGFVALRELIGLAIGELGGR